MAATNAEISRNVTGRHRTSEAAATVLAWQSHIG
jgi:hypothetical protein